MMPNDARWESVPESNGAAVYVSGDRCLGSVLGIGPVWLGVALRDRNEARDHEHHDTREGAMRAVEDRCEDAK